MEGIESLYAARAELRRRRAEAVAARAEDSARLEQKAEYLLRSVAVAREMGSGPKPRKGSVASRAVVKGNPLAELEARAQKELASARRELADRIAAENFELDELSQRIHRSLLDQAEATLAVRPPALTLSIHPVGSRRAILQAERPSDLDAVLLCWLFQRRLPTRWEFFSDDAVEDMAKGLARFYAEEGVGDPWMPDADAEDRVLHGRGELIPVRMMIPIALPRRPFPRFRLVHHGPVAEMESRRKGQPYDRLVDREDAELLTGYLLSLQLDKRLALTLNVQ